MKKFKILALLLAMTASLSISAQTKLGGRIGGNFGFASVDGLANIVTPNINSLNTITGGITFNQRIDDLMSFTSGLHFKRKGFELAEEIDVEIFGADIPFGGSVTTLIDYLEVPLLLNFTFNKDAKVQPYIEVGPAFAFALAGEIRTKAQIIIELNIAETALDLTKDIYNRFEVSGQAVGGIKIPYKKGEFDFGASYTH